MSTKDKASIKPFVLPIPKKALMPYTVVNGWKLVEGFLKELKVRVYFDNSGFIALALV